MIVAVLFKVGENSENHWSRGWLVGWDICEYTLYLWRYIFVIFVKIQISNNQELS